VHARLSYPLVALAMLGGFAVPAAAQTPAAQAPQVTVSGVSYLQYVYQLKDTANHQNNFDVTGLTSTSRTVLGWRQHTYHGGHPARRCRRQLTALSAQVRVRRVYAPGQLAHLQARPDPHALHRLGRGTVGLPHAGQMAMERGAYLSSSDFGLGVDGNWNADKVNMQVGIYNGESYSGGPATSARTSWVVCRYASSRPMTPAASVASVSPRMGSTVSRPAAVSGAGCSAWCRTGRSRSRWRANTP